MKLNLNLQGYFMARALLYPSILFLLILYTACKCSRITLKYGTRLK